MEDNLDVFSSYTNEIQLIEENQLEEERNKFIDLAKIKLSLNHNEVILAMRFLNWNRNEYDEWYDNLEENKVRAGIKLSNETREDLEKKGIKSNGDRCLRCGKMKDNTFFSLNCGHQFCAECWTNYLKEKIRNPPEALRATCPQNGCTCIVYERLYEHYLRNLNDPEIQQYLVQLKKQIISNFSQGDFFRPCPNVACRYYAKSRINSYIQEVYCHCGTNYCFACLKQPHSPCDCELVKTFTELHDNGHGNEINQNFDTFYQRYLACDVSLQDAENIFRNDFNNIIQQLRDRVGFPTEDLDMMRKAFKTVIKVKITLKYAVLFEFFMKECNHKQLFRESQTALQNENEELYRLLLPTYLNPFIERRDGEMLEKIKEDIERRYKLLVKKRAKFNEDAGNTYISDLDENLMNVNAH